MGMRGLASAVVLGLLVSAERFAAATKFRRPRPLRTLPPARPQQAYGMIPPTSYNFYYPGQPRTRSRR